MRGKSERKCTEAAVCLMSSRNSRTASIVGEKQARGKSSSEQGGRIVGDEVRKVNGTQELRSCDFVDHYKDFDSYLNKIRELLKGFEQRYDWTYFNILSTSLWLLC